MTGEKKPNKESGIQKACLVTPLVFLSMAFTFLIGCLVYACIKSETREYHLTLERETGRPDPSESEMKPDGLANPKTTCISFTENSFSDDFDELYKETQKELEIWELCKPPAPTPPPNAPPAG